MLELAANWGFESGPIRTFHDLVSSPPVSGRKAVYREAMTMQFEFFGGDAFLDASVTMAPWTVFGTQSLRGMHTIAREYSLRLIEGRRTSLSSLVREHWRSFAPRYRERALAAR